jgi:hypothetical protein
VTIGRGAGSRGSAEVITSLRDCTVCHPPAWQNVGVRRAPVKLIAIATLACALDTGVAAQRTYPASVTARLRNAAPLSDDEIAEVLQATRESMAYKSLRLSSSPDGQPGIEHLIGSDGRPLLIRSNAGADWRTPAQGAGLDFKGNVVSLTQYTRRAASHCDGTLTPDELVVEYRESSTAPGGWAATAHVRTADDIGGPAFAALTGQVSVQDAGRGQLATRRVRAFTDGTQMWWIDEFRLVLVGWSPSRRAEDARFLVYDPSIDIAPPKGVSVPDCVR